MTETTDRQDPYELAFGAQGMDDRLFPPIAEEADARGQSLDDPDRFLFLSSVGRLLQAIAGGGDGEARGDGGGGIGGVEADGEAPDEADGDGPAGDALRQYGRLLFHAFHFWRTGKPAYALDEEALRRLLDEVTSVGDWSLTAPTRSGYLRLPRHRVWASPAAGLQPEPADGFFWTHVEPADEPGRLHVLLALGVRPDRPGFSVVPATGVLDREAHWAEIDARPDGRDFETTLPGGDLDRLYSIASPAELLKLASLCLWDLDRVRG